MWSGFKTESNNFCYHSTGSVPLVFLHGNITPAFYLPFLPCGRIRWYVPLQAGCAWQNRNAAFNKESLSDCLDELHTFICSLNEATVILMGHSWGAQLALIYASLHPELLHSYILLNPGPFTPEMKMRYKERSAARIPDVERVAWEALRLRVRTALQEKTSLSVADATHYARLSSQLSCAGETAQHCYEVHLLQHGCTNAFASGADEQEVFEAFARLTRPSIPGAVYYGELDYEPIEQGALLQQRLGIESSCIPDSGHYPMIDAPAAFQELLQSLSID